MDNGTVGKIERLLSIERQSAEAGRGKELYLIPSRKQVKNRAK